MPVEVSLAMRLRVPPPIEVKLPPSTIRPSASGTMARAALLAVALKVVSRVPSVLSLATKPRVHMGIVSFFESLWIFV